ncbi:hypothetical protein [Streptomyces sp. NPDC054975]
MRAVRAYFPEHFLNGWTNPDTGTVHKPLPDVRELSQAILDALAGDVPAADRTVEQLGARIAQRWRDHGWADRFYTGQIHSPVGAAVALVRPLKGSDRYGCANPRCDAGRDVDTHQECLVCPERLAARSAARRAPAPASPDPDVSAELPQQRNHRPYRECSCRELIPKDSTGDLCPACRREADDAAETARIRAQLAAQYGTADQIDAYVSNAPF